MTAVEAAALEASDVFVRLGSGSGGLAEDEAARRLRVAGPDPQPLGSVGVCHGLLSGALPSGARLALPCPAERARMRDLWESLS